MAKKSTTSKSVVPKPKDAGVFIDPRTDFGFKRLFGDKELMMDFLNSVLELKSPILNLEYRNTVQIGLSKEEPATIFDLYCTGCMRFGFYLNYKRSRQGFAQRFLKGFSN